MSELSPEQPNPTQSEAVPEENWLPSERKDVDLNVIMRIYTPDLEKFKNWNRRRQRNCKELKS